MPEIPDQERERHRQAAYLYSIIQSAEESEDGGPETDVEKAYDAGIMYAARALLDNWAGDNDWTVDLWEYADEIRARTVPGTPLPSGEREEMEAELRRVRQIAETFEQRYREMAERVERLETSWPSPSYPPSSEPPTPQP